MMLASMMGNFDKFENFGSDSGKWDNMGEAMKEMMGPYRSGGGQVYWQLHWILELVTWGLVIAFLAAAVRWLWRRGDEVGGKKR